MSQLKYDGLLPHGAAFYGIKVTKGSFLKVKQHLRVPCFEIHYPVNLGNHKFPFIYIVGMALKLDKEEIMQFSQRKNWPNDLSTASVQRQICV